MIAPRPIRPNRPNSPPETSVPKPYRLISLPSQSPSPQREKPAGQERFRGGERITGKISLTLALKTATFVASGVVAMGSDLSTQTKNIPLIKTSTERDKRLLIPGSSLKGVVRSIYEAITCSCLCKTKAERSKIPDGYSECRDKSKLCPACQIFGAMGWQGLIQFPDAIPSHAQWTVGFMPSLYAPRKQRPGYYIKGKVAGRKFYYHAIKAVDKGEQRGIPVQQAGKEYTFKTQLRFMNLTLAELGTLLIALGQDTQHPLALKVGGGKPVGMGTMVVEVTEMSRIQTQKEWRDRYCTYNSEPPSLTGNELEQFVRTSVQAAHQRLAQSQQLQELQTVLQWPTDRPPTEGVY